MTDYRPDQPWPTPGRQLRETSQGIQVSEIPPPSPSWIADQQRQAAEHDPDRASACRCCGKTTRRHWAEMAGWKLCDECQQFGSGNAATRLAWNEVLNDDLTPAEATAVRNALGVPWYFVLTTVRATDSGNGTRFQHVNTDRRERVARFVAAHRLRHGLTRNSYRLGCAWCGAMHSVDGWVKCGRSRAVCSTCRPWFSAAGHPANVDTARRWLLGCALGLMRNGRPASAPLGSVDYALRSYSEMQPSGTGTEYGWDYLGDELARIRRHLLRQFPKLASDEERQAIDRDRRIDAAEAKLAAARRPRQVSALTTE